MPRKFSHGFTLIELLVVITIIAILASFAYPVYTGIQERAKVTQDLNNLRQIGLATQTFLNDNDGAFFLPTENWMKKLSPKYLASWKIFQSPFDKRTPSEIGDATTPISYGFNTNAHGAATAPLLAEQITNPSVFVLFAPAPDSSNTVNFTGTAASAVALDKPAGNPPRGTHNTRRRIDACMADLHIENMNWNVFTNDPAGSDPNAAQRWNP